MNPFSRSDWKKAARRAARDPDHAGPGWPLAGLLLIVAVVVAIIKGCTP
jgi:hypothetical protein